MLLLVQLCEETALLTAQSAQANSVSLGSCPSDGWLTQFLIGWGDVFTQN